VLWPSSITTGLPTPFEAVFRIKVVKRYYPMTVVCVLICCNTEGFVTAAKDFDPKMMCDNKY